MKVFFFVILSALVTHGNGANNCPAPSPCICLNELIDCSSRLLSQVPGFTHTQMDFPKLYLNLIGNRISWLSSNGFSALKSTGAKELVVLLDDNQIQTVQDNTFAGVEGFVTEISIQNNRLTNIPAAFGKLTNLHTLLIQGNSLAGLDLSQNFRQSLNTLKFSASNLKEWPTSVSLLHNLQHLSVDKIPFAKLPVESFKGLESSLTTLAIRHSKISDIPASICRLTSLRVLELSNNKQVSVSHSSPVCPAPLPSVETVMLVNNDLNGFPDLFSTFVNAKTIKVSGNRNLLFIPSELLTPKSILQDLNLENNHLYQVPFGVRNLNKLRHLNLISNNIRIIQGDAFDTLHELVNLQLSGNPINYIDTPAFSGLTALSTLGLAGTDLHSVPTAVTSLPQLERMALDNNNMTCDCNLIEDSTWSMPDAIRITGQCQGSSMSIETYLKYYFKLCQ